jgi:K+-sensing histidine kinase KdpD
LWRPWHAIFCLSFFLSQPCVCMLIAIWSARCGQFTRLFQAGSQVDEKSSLNVIYLGKAEKAKKALLDRIKAWLADKNIQIIQWCCWGKSGASLLNQTYKANKYFYFYLTDKQIIYNLLKLIPKSLSEPCRFKITW